MIVLHFATLAESPEGSAFLDELPVEKFKTLCSSDSLYISQEITVVHLVEKYLKHREGLPLLDEENPLKDWTHLTEEEKTKRKEEEKKHEEEEKKKHEEEEKKKEEEFKALDELGKIQHLQKKKLDGV